MEVTDFDFNKEELLEALNNKPLIDDIDGGSTYNHVQLKARGYVTQSEKGIYAGVVESAKQKATRTLVTFFKVDYAHGFIKLWNAKGEELNLDNTATMNRVFRSSDLLDSLGDSNLTEIVNRGKYWLNYAYRKRSSQSYSAGNAFADGIKLSVHHKREREYNLYTTIVGVGGQNSPRDQGLIQMAISLLDEKGIKVNYKSVLRVLGLTKSDVRELKESGAGGILFHDSNNLGTYLGRQSINSWRRNQRPWEVNETFVDASLDYSKGDIQSLPGFPRSPRFALELAKILVRVSEEYNYDLSLRDALHEILDFGGSQSLRDLGASIRAINRNGATKNVDLTKLLRYLYIDITMHQGIRNLSDAISLYRDYINLVGSIEGFTVYPKYLSVAHDIASKAFNESDAYDNDIREYTEQFLDMEGIYRVSAPGVATRNYPLVVLRTGTEISEEATNQSNCLASYISNVVSQSDFILSLKKPVDDPKHPDSMESFVSVEVARTVDEEGNVILTLRQAYKTFNRNLDKDLMDVLQSIMEANGVRTDGNVIGFGRLENNTPAKVLSKTPLKGVHEDVSTVEASKEEVNNYLKRL